MLVDRDRARDSIHALSDQDLVELLSEEFSPRPDLRPARDDVTALLAMGPALALQHEMLDSTAVSRALGRAATSSAYDPAGARRRPDRHRIGAARRRHVAHQVRSAALVEDVAAVDLTHRDHP